MSTYLLRHQQIYPQLPNFDGHYVRDKGKTLNEISIKNFSSGEQLTHREKLRTMKELLIRYPDKYVMIRNAGTMPSQWYRYPDGREVREFDTDLVLETLKTIHPPADAMIYTYYEDFNKSDDRQRTERWLEVFNHYFIKPNEEMKPVGVNGLVDTVKRFKQLYLAFEEILEKVRDA